MFFALFTMDDVYAIIENSLRGLCAWICEIIYPLIADAYNLFVTMGKIVYVEDFNRVYNKISMIIGIFMVFRVTFWLIEMLVNPDIISEKEKKPSNLIKKIFVSTILLATTPKIFQHAIDLQLLIVDNHVIEKIVSPYNTNPDVKTGNEIAANLFINFYTINRKSETIGFAEQECSIPFGVTGDQPPAYITLINDGEMTDLNNYCLTARYKNPEDGTIKKEAGGKIDYNPYQIDFNGIFAVGIGILVFWMLIMYCISIGARYVQMIFLQIIAPIPIMCNLTPGKDNMFTKWVKQCTVTYLDLFIRIAIINFVLLLCQMVLSDAGIFETIVDEQGNSNFWIKVFLVLGLLTFAKKAPELIQELLPTSISKASGDFGLSLKKRTDNMLFGGLVRGAGRLATTGVIGAAATGVVGFLGGRGMGRITGLLGGTFRGLASGAKSGNVFQNLQNGINQQSERNKRKIDLRNSGSTLMGRMNQRMANVFGAEGKAETLENQVSGYNKQLTELKSRSAALNEVSGSVGKMKDRANSKLDGDTLSNEYQKGLQTRRRNYRGINQAMANGNETAAMSIVNSEYNRVSNNLISAKNNVNYTENKVKELAEQGKNTGDREYDLAIKEHAEAKRQLAVVNKEDQRIRGIKEAIETKRYNAALSDGDMADVLKETQEEYVEYSLFDKSADSVISTEESHIKKVMEHSDNREVFAQFGLSNNNQGFKDFDKLSNEAKKANNVLNEEIYEINTAKEAIEHSEEKRKADADRNAVGGHQGGKK